MGDRASGAGTGLRRPQARKQSAGRGPATGGAVAEFYPTLGPIVCDWIEEYLVHGPGDIQGTPIELDDEFRAFIWRAYELYPRDHPLAGRRCFRRAVLSRPKGRAKSELAGMIACTEALGPVRFDGWDADGDPVGLPITNPVIRCFATEADQAGNTFDNALFMIENGTVYDEYPGIDSGITRINLPDGGSIVSTTSAASSKDGGKDTFNVFDETHLWVTPRLKSLHATVTRNLIKRKIADGWALETSTMYCPGEESVAEETHKAMAGGLAGVLFDHRQAPLDVDIHDDEQLRAALEYVYGPAAAWTNIDSIVQDEFRNPIKRESECRRYWLNQPWSMEEVFVLPAEWDACLREGAVIPDHEQVVLALDGSRTDDSTGLLACSVNGMQLQVVGLWEKPDTAGAEDWRVPRLDVMETMRQACKRWNVVEIAADPFMWAQTLEELEDEGLPVVEFPQNGSRMIPATKRLYDLILTQGIGQDGNENLRRHILNARTKADSRGFRIEKDKKASAFKIDLAVCAVMAVERACVYAEEGDPQIWSVAEAVERLRKEREPQQEQQPAEGIGPSQVRFIPF